MGPLHFANVPLTNVLLTNVLLTNVLLKEETKKTCDLSNVFVRIRGLDMGCANEAQEELLMELLPSLLCRSRYCQSSRAFCSPLRILN
jgi:hypothetical protein